MFKVNNKDFWWVSLLLTLNIFHTLSSVSIVNFEHAIAGWDIFLINYEHFHDSY